MDFRNLTISDFKKNYYNRYGTIFLTICIICLFVTIVLVSLMSIGVLGDSYDVVFYVALLGAVFIGFAAFVLFFLAIDYLPKGKKGKKAVLSFIREMGEENFLNEVHNETIHIFSRGKVIFTVFTAKHIIDLNSGVYPANDINYVYPVSHRGKYAYAYMVAFSYDGRKRTFGKIERLVYSKQEIAKIFNALITANDNLQVGPTCQDEIRVQRYGRQL